MTEDLARRKSSFYGQHHIHNIHEKDGVGQSKIHMVPYKELFRFSNTEDAKKRKIGCVFSFLHGGALPALTVVFGMMTEFLVKTDDLRYFLEVTIKDFRDQFGTTVEKVFEDSSILNPDGCTDIKNYYAGISNKSVACTDAPFKGRILEVMAIWYISFYVGLGVFVLVVSRVQMACWFKSAEIQTYNIRQALIQAILRQEVAWFDKHPVYEMKTRLCGDITKVHEAIGETTGSMIQWLATILSAFGIGLYFGKLLALVLGGVIVVKISLVVLKSKFSSRTTVQDHVINAPIHSNVRGVLENIKTVTAFGGQEKELARYSDMLKVTESFTVKRKFLLGVLNGLITLLIFGYFIVGVYFGRTFYLDRKMDVASIVTCFFSLFLGFFAIDNKSHYFHSLEAARASAFNIYAIIDRDPLIDAHSEGTQLPGETFDAKIEFKNVTFAYPSRPDVKILNNVTFTIAPGKLTVFVGRRSSGKSTVLHLLMRFYDPDEGEIMLNGVNIRLLNLSWYRRKIGYLSQDPVLISFSIDENVVFGKSLAKDKVRAVADNAYRAALCYFINDLPKTSASVVGDPEVRLSMMKKQKIALARAVVLTPPMMVVYNAEAKVDWHDWDELYKAIHRARRGRTCIMSSEYIACYEEADLIIYMDDGAVVDQGTHRGLMVRRGAYHARILQMTALPKPLPPPPVQRKSLAARSRARHLTAKKVESTSDISHDESQSELVPDAVSIRKKVERDANERKRGRSIFVIKQLLDGGIAKPRGSTDNVTAEDDGEDDEEDDDESEDDKTYRRLFRYNIYEVPYIFVGCLSSIMVGAVYPALAYFFGQSLHWFTKYGAGKDDLVMQNITWAAGVGCGAFMGVFLQTYCFGKSGERLTTKLRERLFASIVKQDIHWFELEENQPSHLCHRINQDCSLIQGLTGVRLGNELQSVSCIFLAFYLAFQHSWQLTLAVLGLIPITMLFGFYEVKLINRVTTAQMKGHEKANLIAVDTFRNIRMVAALTSQQDIVELYMKQLKAPRDKALDTAGAIATAYGVCQAMVFFSFAGAFSLGAFLIEQVKGDYMDVFLVYTAIVACAVGVGNVHGPSVNRAKMAARHILEIMDRQPTIDYTAMRGDKIRDHTGRKHTMANGFKGAKWEAKITFNNVSFSWHAGYEQEHLTNIQFSVPPKSMTCFVGPKGCGKTQILWMIQRLYDPNQGKVYLNGKSLKRLNIKWLRSQIGVVFRDPHLFSCSIRDNIAYGDTSGDSEVDLERIIHAAREANAHDAITALPLGYEANALTLSRGQQQRVALARALIRAPRILLLHYIAEDVDPVSEDLLVDAVGRARRGRLVMSVADKLLTVQSADQIYVIEDGQVKEHGQHVELLHNEGPYFRMVNSV